MQATDIIFKFIILSISIIIHEVAHGYAAYKEGDEMALHAGRLTLNPLKHLDPVGSVILPLIIAFSTNGMFFGWAKPVPINPNNFKNRKSGMLKVSFAGILANLALALVFGLLVRWGLHTGYIVLMTPLFKLLSTIIIINLSLAFFNILPVPPLDGSKILLTLLPERYALPVEIFLTRYSLLLLVVVVLVFGIIFTPIAFFLYELFTGVPFTALMM